MEIIIFSFEAKKTFSSSTPFLFWFESQYISIDEIFVETSDFSLGLFHFETFNNITLKNSAIMGNFIRNGSFFIDYSMPFGNYSAIKFENNSFIMNRGGIF